MAAIGLLLFVGFFLLTSSETISQTEHQHHDMINKLSETLKEILKNTCGREQFSLFISTQYKNLSKVNRNLVTEVLDNCLNLQESEKWPVSVVLATQPNNGQRFKAHLELVFVESVEQLRNSISITVKKTVFLVVWLTSERDIQKRNQLMSEMFSHFLHQLYKLDVLLILVHMEMRSIEAFTFRPYQLNNCASTSPMKVDPKMSRMIELYPHKLDNFYGCPLSVIVWDIPPYMIRKGHDIDGFEAVVLKILSQKKNFTVQLMENEPKSLMGGSSYMNGTMTGAYLMLMQRKANVTLGCAACTPERRTYLSSTLPYNQIGYVIVMKSPPGYSAYEIMLFPFDYTTWLLLGGLAIFQHWFGPLPAPLHAGWIMLHFIFRSGYEGSIFKFVHNSPSKPLPLTILQTVEAGYNFITDHATYRMTINLPILRSRTRVIPGQPVDVFKALRTQPPRTAAFTSPAFLAQYLHTHRNQFNEYIILEEKVVDNMICMYFPHYSFLAGMIDSEMFKLRSCGILIKIGKKLDWNFLRSNDRRYNKDMVKGFEESMCFLQAALNCLLIGLAITLCVFLLELLSQRRGWSWLRYCLNYM